MKSKMYMEWRKKKKQVFLYLEKYMSIHYNFLWGHFQLGKKTKNIQE